MGKLQQSRESLEKHLREQVSFLKTSTSLFDQGDLPEAKRIGATLRLLLHDTKTSKSLFGQLGFLSIPFLDSAKDWNPRNLISHHGLVGIVLQKGEANYFARFKQFPIDASPTSEFSRWWNKVVIVDSSSTKFSRKGLVLSIVETDGGAHIDPALEKSYLQLTRLNSVGWRFVSNGAARDISNIELYSIRQICEELLATIQKGQILSISFEGQAKDGQASA